MEPTPHRSVVWLAGAVLLTALGGCDDGRRCRPYVAEVRAAAHRPGVLLDTDYAKALHHRVAAVTGKYGDRAAQCRAAVGRALGLQLIRACVADPRTPRDPGCPKSWSKKQCCRLTAFCVLRYPTAAPYCRWEPTGEPPPSLPRCTTCPGCVPEGTQPQKAVPVNLWLGGDGDTLAAAFGQPVNDAWLLPLGAPPEHLEDLLYGLWKQPAHLAPQVAVVRGETVPIDGWNTLEQALHAGGWTRLGLNLGQWQGRLRCSAEPPARTYRFPPAGHPLTITVGADQVWVQGQPAFAHREGGVVDDPQPRALTIEALRRALPTRRAADGHRLDAVRIAVHRGLTVEAGLVARILYTATNHLQGAHARLVCVPKADER